MKSDPLDSVFTQYQQPLLFVVPVDADQVATINQLIAKNTPYTKPSQHPAIVWINLTQETIGIDVSRQLATEIAYSPLDANVRIFVIIGFESATTEAQNALLKLFESQTNQSQFWLITQNLSRILPTIQSRCVMYQIPANQIIYQDSHTHELSQLFTAITNASVQECIALAGKYTDRVSAQEMIASLLNWITQQTDFTPTANQLLQLQTAYARIAQNTNVKLALESAFFGLSGAKDHF